MLGLFSSFYQEIISQTGSEISWSYRISQSRGSDLGNQKSSLQICIAFSWVTGLFLRRGGVFFILYNKKGKNFCHQNIGFIDLGFFFKKNPRGKNFQPSQESLLLKPGTSISKQYFPPQIWISTWCLLTPGKLSCSVLLFSPLSQALLWASLPWEGWNSVLEIQGTVCWHGLQLSFS